MRHKSPKRAARDREAKPFRDALKKRIGRCEVCGHDPERAKRMRGRRVAWALHVHEIARGAHREKAQDKPYATLVVCWRCHHDELSNAAEWPQSRQLAALKRSRPADYDLAAFNKLVNWGKDRIAEEEVERWLR